MKQFVITPAAGKRLIGKAIAKHAAVATAIKKGTVVIVAGTTNGYVAEEITFSAGSGKGIQTESFLPRNHSSSQPSDNFYRKTPGRGQISG